MILRRKGDKPVEIAEPPGARSCHQPDPDAPGGTVPGSGGNWELATTHKGVAPLKTQREELLSKLASDEMRAVFQAEWAKQLENATKGRCVYGAGYKDVSQMASAKDVLELRVGSFLFAEGEDGQQKRMAVRYFFSEPAALPDVLLGLTVYWKVPEDVSREEQTAAAQKAARLLRASELRNYDR